MIGTLCVAILAQLVVNPFFRKKKIAMSDCVIIVFYCTTLANGIMVSPRGRALAWLMTFVVYFIVKYLETRNKTILIKRESYA